MANTNQTVHIDGIGTVKQADLTELEGSDTAYPPTPELVDVKLASEGWINKYALTYRLADGSSYEYEAASRKGLEAFRAGLEANAQGKKPRPDAVCIVPVLPNDQLLLIREFRYPLNAWCTAFPAGLLEPRETIRQCVERELHEEVGCRLDDAWGDETLTALPQAGFSSTGMTDESVQIVVAHVDWEDEGAEPERGELIWPFVLPVELVDKFLERTTDMIGTRAQLMLEMISRVWPQGRKQPKPQEPLTRHDFA